MKSTEKIIPLYALNGEHLGTISVAKATEAYSNHEMILSSKGSGRKFRITAAHLVARKPTFSAPRATLTMSDMLANAEVNPELRKRGRIRAAIEKVAGWPAAYDDRNTGICAGVVINPTYMKSIPETLVSFA